MDPFSHVQHFNFSAFEKAFETAKTASNFIFLSKTTFFNLFYFYDVSEMLRSYLYSGVESSLSSTINAPWRQFSILGGWMYKTRWVMLIPYIVPDTTWLMNRNVIKNKEKIDVRIMNKLYEI